MLQCSPGVDSIFHALGDPSRRLMVERLSRGPASVSELAAPFSMSLAAVVQHVKVLEESGVITSQKVGRVRTCQLAPEGLLAAEKWMSERRSLWERRLHRLDVFLEEEDPSAEEDEGE